jgi:hypothetical protein
MPSPDPHRQRFHRRRRSVLGKDWQPPRVQDVGAGVWCPASKRRHGYNGTGKVLSDYEKRGNVFVLMWLCPKSNDVIGELYLGGSMRTECD